MVRKMVALLVSGAVLIGGMNAALAQAASAQPANPASSVSAAPDAKADRNATPLPPGGAAGIRQAQGGGETIWNIIGLGFLGGVVLAMIFVGNDEDDEEVPTTTTSN
jgi:hypothetical protein